MSQFIVAAVCGHVRVTRRPCALFDKVDEAYCREFGPCKCMLRCQTLYCTLSEGKSDAGLLMQCQVMSVLNASVCSKHATSAPLARQCLPVARHKDD